MQPNEEVTTLPQLFEFITRRMAGAQHNHQWAIIELQAQPVSPTIHPRVAQRPQTLVLLKCHCGMPLTLMLEGDWTMTQLQQSIGEQHATKREARNETAESPYPTGEYGPTK